MQYKNAIAIVQEVASMPGMHICSIWNADAGHMLMCNRLFLMYPIITCLSCSLLCRYVQLILLPDQNTQFKASKGNEIVSFLSIL